MRRLFLFPLAAAGLALAVPGPASAYPIDCAILLCLAGGFPSNPVCDGAKAEVIRRITPWPVEPPLQLWRCPLGIDPAIASEIGMTVPLGSDGLTDDVRRYRDGVEIYHIRFEHRRSHDDETISDNTRVGRYSAVTGEFSWVPSSYQHGPAWLASVAGGTRRASAIDDCDRSLPNCRPRPTNVVNDFRGRLRAVAMRFRDEQGNYHTEIVRY